MPGNDLAAILRAGIEKSQPYSQAPTEEDVARAKLAMESLARGGGLPDLSSLGPARANQIVAPAAPDLAAVKAAQEKAAFGAGLADIPTPYTRLAASQGHAPDLRSPYATYLQKMGEGDQQRLALQQQNEQERAKMLNAFITSRANATKQYADESASARALTSQKDADREAANLRAQAGIVERRRASLERLKAASERHAATLARREANATQKIANDADKRAAQDNLMAALREDAGPVEEWLRNAPAPTGSTLVDYFANPVRSAVGQKAEFDAMVQPLKTAIGQFTSVHGDQQRVALMMLLKKSAIPEFEDTLPIRLAKMKDLRDTLEKYWLKRQEEEERHARVPGNIPVQLPGKKASGAPPLPNKIQLIDTGADLDALLEEK